MKKMMIVLVLTLAAVFAFAGGTSEASKSAQAGTEKSGTYTWGGSTTVAPIAVRALEAYQQMNPKLKISYEQPGSSAGIKQLVAGVYSLAGSSRDLTKEEIAGGLVEIPIALDGLSVVVNKTVGIDNLSIEQLANIFSGKIVNWKEVGGADAPIQVVNRDEASGTYAAFLELVVQKAIKGAKFTTNAIVTKENGEVAAKVGSTPNAIGYIGMAFTDMVKSAGGKVLTVGGIEDTIPNVVAKKYPISRSLYLISKGELKAGSVEKGFVDFVLSAKGQAIVKQAEFIPLPPK